MKILALEFSPPERTAAVVIDGQVRAHAKDPTQKGGAGFALLSQVLEAAAVKAKDIECVAVGLGPGSFAGTRMAIAMAQGWQLGREAKLAGIRSADAIAHLAQRSGLCGMINVVCDAQRNEAFALRYEVVGDAVRVSDCFELLTLDVETRRRNAGELFLKGDDGPWGGRGVRTIYSDAGVIGQLAEQGREFGPGSALEPVYLRKAEFIKAPSPRFSAPEMGEKSP